MLKLNKRSIIAHIFASVVFGVLLQYYWQPNMSSILDGVMLTFQTNVNELDVIQILLGYSPHIKGDHDYLFDSDFIQILMPLSLHLLACIVSISFIALPYDLVKMFIPRFKNSRHLFRYITKKSKLHIVLYSLTLLMSIEIFLMNQTFLSSASSYHYQSISPHIGLIQYVILLLLIVLALQKYIYLGYLHRKIEQHIFIAFIVMVLLHILDRFVHTVNFVLFDFVNYLVDSYIFWGVINIILLIFISREAGHYYD